MSYKNLSIGKKIAVVFAVIAAINVIFGFFSPANSVACGIGC
ncbi:hypothetical protein [Aeromonas media]